jgi:hypothetical protein
MSLYSIGVYLWRAHGGTRFRQTHVATRLDWILRSNVIEAHKSFKNSQKSNAWNGIFELAPSPLARVSARVPGDVE